MPQPTRPRPSLTLRPRRRSVAAGPLGWWVCGSALVGLLLATPLLAQGPRRRDPDAPRGRRSATPPAEGVSTGSRDDLGGKRNRRDDVESDSERSSRWADGPLAKLAAYAEESREAMNEVRDYTAIFSRKELVKRQLVQQKMEMKYRHEPFSVYFHFISPEEAGREVIYVDGGFKNRLVVHEAGIKAIAGTMYLPLNDPRVTQESRYPITNVGMHNILKKAFETFDLDAADDQVVVKKYPAAKLEDKECVAFVIRHPEPVKGVPFHETRLYFDKETKLPIHVERYDWPRRAGEKPQLVEEYSYKKVKINVGLTNADFDPRNPRYQFPR